MYQALQHNEVRPHLIRINQAFSYLHLVLRWPPSAKIKTKHVARETGQPARKLVSESTYRQRVVFQYHYPARLLSSPFDSAPVIPVSSVIPFIDKKVRAKFASQQCS
ncbi:hypothetical protein B8Z58_005104 [Enterobacter roggenkampii]|nr:hypothetical protein [Enterobacter roggenkampii]